MDRRNTAIALGVATLGVAFATLRPHKKDVTADRAHSSRTVTIRSDAQTLYDLWRTPEHLAELYRGAEMQIVNDAPGVRYEWRTVARAPYSGGGSLTFTTAPGDRGTQVRLALHLDGPGAHALAAFARLYGSSPAQIAMESLRDFKALAETGEVPTAGRS
jgi:uncharacterized membrane protein